MTDSPSPMRPSVAADLGSLAEVFARAAGPVMDAGTVIGDHFELEEPLGRGGMGAVYRAHDRELDRRVAIKIGLGGTNLARARREAIALARLAHPNVITIHEIGEHEGVPFVAMELCEGGTVRTWARAAPRTWREILGVFLDAGRGLAAAHAAGLLHRDVKPDNILLGADGRARIADFGLARDAGVAAHGGLPDAPGGTSETTVDSADAPPLTVAGALVGTPRYMAPEQLAGASLDARTDQFAFCIALYECLAGVDPFPAAPGERAAAMAAWRVLPPARERAVPRKVLAVIERGLAPSPAARFPTMDALLTALTRAARPRWRTLAPLAGVMIVVTAVTGAAVVAARDPGERIIVAAAPEPSCAELPAELTPGWNAATRGAFIAGNASAGEAARWAAEVIDHQVRVLAAARAACQDLMPRTDRSAAIARTGGAGCLLRASAKIAEVSALRGQDPGELTTAAGRVVESAACAANLSATAASPDRTGPIWAQIAEAERLALAGETDRAIAVAEQARSDAQADSGETVIMRAEFTLGTILEQQARRAGPPPRLAIERRERPPAAVPIAPITAAAPGLAADRAAVPVLVALDGELHVFVRSSTGTLLTARRTRDERGRDGTWTPLAQLVAGRPASPQALVGEPAVLAAEGLLEVFYRHPVSGHLLHAIRARAGWVVRDEGGLVARIDTPVRAGAATRLTFVAPDPSLYPWFDQRTWFATTSSAGTTRSTWSLLPEHVAPGTRPAAIATRHGDRVDVVALDNRGHLAWHTGGRAGFGATRWIWRPEELARDVELEEPRLVTLQDEPAGLVLAVVVRAHDGQLFIARTTGDATAFGALTPLGARSDSAPAVVARGPGRIAIVGHEAGALFVLDVRATDAGGLRTERSRAAPPVGSPSSVTGALGATADAGALHVVVVGADGGLQHRRLP